MSCVEYQKKFEFLQQSQIQNESEYVLTKLQNDACHNITNIFITELKKLVNYLIDLPLIYLSLIMTLQLLN